MPCRKTSGLMCVIIFIGAVTCVQDSECGYAFYFSNNALVYSQCCEEFSQRATMKGHTRNHYSTNNADTCTGADADMQKCTHTYTPNAKQTGFP